MKILIFILILIFIIYNSFQISHFNSLNFMLETEKDKYRFTADTAVSILKPTLTLYYDRYDINSKYFYDDAKVVLGEKIINLISRRKSLVDEYNYLEKNFNDMINEFENNTDIINPIPSNNIKNYELNIEHHYIFRTKTNGYNQLEGKKYNKFDIKNLTLNDYLENFYTTLKNSKYDYSDFITKIEDLQDFVDKKSDIFDIRSNVRPRTQRDFGWNFGDKSKRLKLIKGNDEDFNEIVSEIDDYLDFKYKEGKYILTQELELEIDREIRVSNLGPWNQIKLIHEYNYFPFLHQDMITLEEVYCKDGKMSECVSKKIVTYSKGNYEDLAGPSEGNNNNYLSEETNNNSLSEETNNNNDISMIGKLGVDREFSFGEERIIIDQDRTRQYPRNEEIVDKLPKIIFTYQKYEKDGLIDNKTTKIIEYEGIYNINNQFMRVGTNNILKFLEECFRENLEITEGGDVDSKKTNHKQIINSIDENLAEHNDFKEINLVVPKEIKNNPNFNINYTKIYKCKDCPEFILE